MKWLTTKLNAPGGLQAYGGTTQDGADVPEAARVAYRDRVVNDLIYVIDYDYDHFKRNFMAGTSAADFFGDAMVLGLNAAGTAVGAKETKTLLSAIATGAGGVNTTFTKDILFTKQITTVLNQMDTDRQKQLQTIPAAARRDSSSCHHIRTA